MTVGDQEWIRRSLGRRADGGDELPPLLVNIVGSHIIAFGRDRAVLHLTWSRRFDSSGRHWCSRACLVAGRGEPEKKCIGADPVSAAPIARQPSFNSGDGSDRTRQHLQEKPYSKDGSVGRRRGAEELRSEVLPALTLSHGGGAERIGNYGDKSEHLSLGSFLVQPDSICERSPL